MSLIQTNTGRTVFKNAESIMFVPYVYDNAAEDYILGNDIYDVTAIIGDSITVEQSEGSSVRKDNEFIANPLLEIYSGVKYGFAAQCIDLQNSVLKSIFGAMTISGTGGAAAFLDDYVLAYALVRIRFRETNLPDVILPKVQLNSKLFINQLKTRVSQGNIAGTALGLKTGVKNSVGSALSSFSLLQTSESAYVVSAPVIIVPRNRNPLFYCKKATGSLEYYSSINFSTGTVSNNVLVDPSTGALPTPGSGGGETPGGGGEEPGGGS